MNNFFVYHNEAGMKCTIKDIGLLRGVTNNSIAGSKDGTAWVISGVGTGAEAKSFFLSSFFIIAEEKPNSWPYPDFQHAIVGREGSGLILPKPIEITHESWLPDLQKETNNFYGFRKILGTKAIYGLLDIIKPYASSLTVPSTR